MSAAPPPERAPTQVDPAPAHTTPIPRWVATALGVALGVAALYFGREIFVPFALAVLLSFVLDPLVTRLRQARLNRGAAVALVMSLTLLAGGAASVFVASQVMVISKNLPTYEHTIHAKLGWVRKALTGRGMFDDVSRMFDVVEGELDATRTAMENTGRSNTKPMRVQVEPARPSPLTALAHAVEPIFSPLATAGIVVLFVVFILLERSDLRDRMLRLVGGNLHRSTDATNEAARRVSRYLTTQLMVNLGFAVPMGIGLYAIGVPGALLWGLLAGVLRFLPYLGPVLAAAFPLGMAFAVDPGWSMLLWTAALIISLELVINNLIEPWLYGASTGLTPMAVVVSAMFWATLWGPVGLVLATPLTVCLVVMSRHIPTLQFLDVLLGSQPVFDPPTRLYRRLLSGDVEEAAELAHEQVQAEGLAGFYHHSALPALLLAAQDHALTASVQHRHHVARGMARLIDELALDHPPATPASDAPQVLCIGSRWELDGLAARLWCDALRHDGYAARALPASAITAEHIAALDLSTVSLVCLSYFSHEPDAHLRYVLRRLRRRHPGLRVVAGLWRADPDWARETLHVDTATTACVFDLDAALSQVRTWLPLASDKPAEATPLAMPPERLQALHGCGALLPSARLLCDQAAQSAADQFQAPLAVACVMTATHELWQGMAEPHNRWPPPEQGLDRSLAPEAALCAPVLAADDAVTIPDLTRDPRLAHHDLLRARDLRFYAAVPLRTADGIAVGALCILHTEPRTLPHRELALLQGMADALMATLQALQPGPAATAPQPLQAPCERPVLPSGSALA